MTEEAKRLRALLEAGPLPAHVGIIMDGNGRWAQGRGLPRIEGHREGSRSVRVVTTAARELNIPYLTLYAFSAQNWARPKREVLGLMELLRTYLLKEQATLLDNGIRLEAIGQLDKLPGRVRKALDQVREATSSGKEMVLTLALSYGGQEELVEAARAVAREVRDGRLDPESLDTAGLQRRLWSGRLPELDLCIRTSGEFRVSNFLLWHVSYAEIVVADVLWPDFREEALYEALLAYRTRERRFGMTGQQLRERTT